MKSFSIIDNLVMNPDFKEFVQSLSTHNVRYLIVGGDAVAYHGHPRDTKDLDNLRKNKQASDRPQDLADLDNLS